MNPKVMLKARQEREYTCVCTHKKCVLSLNCVFLLGDTEAAHQELGGAGGGGQLPVQTLGVVPGTAHITNPNTSTKTRRGPW